MRKNCNLELRLVPPSRQFSSLENESTGKTKQELTIFYNGETAVCDVTDLQARSIISLASREMDPASSSPTTPLIQPQTPSPNGLSVRTSLQRFLQKRNNRAQLALPYHP